jgi:hypothetical protein
VTFALSLAALVAGTPSPSPVRTIDPARVTPGLLGLASLLFLVIAGFFLARSMTKQFKKIDFDEDATEPRRRGPSAPVPATDESVEQTPNGAPS